MIIDTEAMDLLDISIALNEIRAKLDIVKKAVPEGCDIRSLHFSITKLEESGMWLHKAIYSNKKQGKEVNGGSVKVREIQS